LGVFSFCFDIFTLPSVDNKTQQKEIERKQRTC